MKACSIIITMWVWIPNTHVKNLGMAVLCDLCTGESRQQSQADSKTLPVSLLRKAGSFLFRERPCLKVLRQRSIEEGFRYHVLDSACMCMLCIPYVKHTHIFFVSQKGNRKKISNQIKVICYRCILISTWVGTQQNHIKFLCWELVPSIEKHLIIYQCPDWSTDLS